MTVSLGKANDVIENVFLSLRAWEHKFELTSTALKKRDDPWNVDAFYGALMKASSALLSCRSSREFSVTILDIIRSNYCVE